MVTGPSVAFRLASEREAPVVRVSTNFQARFILSLPGENGLSLATPCCGERFRRQTGYAYHCPSCSSDFELSRTPIHLQAPRSSQAFDREAVAAMVEAYFASPLTATLVADALSQRIQEFLRAMIGLADPQQDPVKRFAMEGHTLCTRYSGPLFEAELP